MRAGGSIELLVVVSSIALDVPPFHHTHDVLTGLGGRGGEGRERGRRGVEVVIQTDRQTDRWMHGWT